MPRDQTPVSSSPVLTLAIAVRLVYVGFVAIALWRQERAAVFTRMAGAEAGFRRFKRVAVILMNGDAAAFILLCVVTPRTFTSPASVPVTIIAGIALIVLGLGVKLWAARTLGPGAYYWRNFFFPPQRPEPVAAGPYRFVANPMYTVGYLQTYGLALVFTSWPGLIAAAIAQTSILVMYVAVEKPHFDRLHGD